MDARVRHRPPTVVYEFRRFLHQNESSRENPFNHSEIKNAEAQLYGDKNRRFFSVDLGWITKNSTFIIIYESCVIWIGVASAARTVKEDSVMVDDDSDNVATTPLSPLRVA